MKACQHGIQRVFLPLLCRVMLLMALLLGASSTFANEASKFQLTAAEQEWLSQHPVIPVGVDGRWPPVDFFNDQQQHSGILNNYLSYFQQVLGITFAPKQFDSFEKMSQAVQQGDIPFASTLVQTDARDETLWFTEPYFSAMKVLVSNRDNQQYSSLSSLRGKTLALEQGFFLIDVIQRGYPEIHIRTYPDTKQALIALATSDVDAYIGNQAVVRWLMANLQINNLVVSGDPGLSLSLQRFAVYKDPQWFPLVNILNKVLAEIPQEEEQRILQNWMAVSDSVPLRRGLEFTVEEQAYLQSLSSLTIGADSDWPPFDFLNDQGLPDGLSKEYNEQISALIGKPLIPVYEDSWQDSMDAFRRGELDMLSAVDPTPERLQYMRFSKPYMTHPYMILVHSDTRFVNSFSDLQGKRIAVGQAFAIEEIMRREHPELELVPYKKAADALLAVSAREVDAYVGLLGTSSWILERYGIRNVKVAAPTGYQYEQTIGVRKDKPVLLRIINKAIDQIPDYKKQEIKNNWFKVEFEHQVTRSQIFRAVAITLAILFPILMVILIWNRKLKWTQQVLQDSQKKLAEAKDSAEQASQFKSQFLANMSHEIRTPMNAIVGMNHLLLRSGLNERQQDYAEKIKQSATALLGVINDILDFSKVEAGRLDIDHTPFNLHSVFTELSDMLSLKASEIGRASCRERVCMFV